VGFGGLDPHIAGYPLNQMKSGEDSAEEQDHPAPIPVIPFYERKNTMP